MLNKLNILKHLNQLGLNLDEAKLYLELLRSPNTHLRLSVITGINRTKVYRLIENLEKKSLVARQTDDKGTFLMATEPSIFEITLATKEEKVKKQRAIFAELLPSLEVLRNSQNTKHSFVVKTYEGAEGFKQMLWHETKAQEELLVLGGQTIEHLMNDHYWAEKYRMLTVEAGHIVKEIFNDEISIPVTSNNDSYKQIYESRFIPSNVVYFNEQITIYNNTVAIYHWRDDQKIGIEIMSHSYTTLMRQVFKSYWEIAK